MPVLPGYEPIILQPLTNESSVFWDYPLSHWGAPKTDSRMAKLIIYKSLPTGRLDTPERFFP